MLVSFPFTELNRKHHMFFYWKQGIHFLSPSNPIQILYPKSFEILIFPFKKKKFYLLEKGWKAGRKNNNKLMCWFCFPNACSSQEWPLLQPRAQEFICFKCGWRRPKHLYLTPMMHQ